jgi:hypothetical protein
VIVLAITVKLASAVVPPMAPVKVVLPEVPDFTTKDPPPLITSKKLTVFPPAESPPLVLSIIELLEKETGPVIRMVPAAVVTLLAMLMAVTLALVVVAAKFPSAVVPPTAPTRVIAPVPHVKVSACDPVVVPSIVPPKEITPLFVLVLIVVVPANTSVVGTTSEIVNEFAVILPPTETALVPAADEINRSPSRVVPPTTPVNMIVPAEPEFKVSPCDPAVVALSVVEKVIPAPPALPPLLVVSKVPVPVKEAIPVIPMVAPLVMMFPPMLMAVVVAFVDVAEKTPSAVVLPIFPESVIAPVPDVKVSACDPVVVPSIVPPKEITPLFVLVLIVVVPAKTSVVGTTFVIVNEFAVILLPIETVLLPAVDEMRIAPSRVAPIIPEKVMAPVDPAFKVRF